MTDSTYSNYDAKTVYIVLAEDETDLRNGMTKVMSMLLSLYAKAHDKTDGIKYKVIARKNGLEAYETLLELADAGLLKHTMLFTDDRMPIMSGGELYTKIREHKLNSDLLELPIIIATGGFDEDLPSPFGSDKNATALTKPVDIDVMENMFNKMLPNLRTAILLETAKNSGQTQVIKEAKQMALDSQAKFDTAIANGKGTINKIAHFHNIYTNINSSRHKRPDQSGRIEDDHYWEELCARRDKENAEKQKQWERAGEDKRDMVHAIKGDAVVHPVERLIRERLERSEKAPPPITPSR